MKGELTVFSKQTLLFLYKVLLEICKGWYVYYPHVSVTTFKC